MSKAPSTVGELKNLLEDVDDDVAIVVPSQDHGYTPARAYVSTGLFDRKYRSWTEDHGENATPESEFGERRYILLVE